MKTLDYSPQVRTAVARVGLTPEEVVEVLGSCLEGDSVYLVGSLAPGLGNADSDIDLHVFVPDEAPGVVPMLFFAGCTRLDLVVHQATAPGAALLTLPRDHVGLAGGVCALGEVPGMTDLKRLSRWATAVPFFDGSPQIFDAAEIELITAALVRAALDTTVRAAALAHVMTLADSALAGLAWTRAAEAAVEAVVRAEGDIFVGDKWLPAKVRRCTVGSSALGAARRVESAEAYDGFVERLGLPIAGPADLVTVAQTGGPEFTFGPDTFRLVGTKLVAPIEIPSNSLQAELARDALAVHEAVASGAATIDVDVTALDRRLR